jgi:RimJ/RimL family protein N-acetyltransferase
MTRFTFPVDLGAVTVRYLLPRDHGEYISLERNPEVRRFVNGPSTRSDAGFAEQLEQYVAETSLLVVAAAEDDRLIGRCGVLPKSQSREAEIFCLLAKSHWGKGIGQRVFQFLVELATSQGHRPFCLVDPKNASCRKLLEKIEMIEVGFHQSNDYQHGHIRYSVSGTTVLNT